MASQVCFSCNNVGHWYRDCPARSQQQQRNPQPRQDRSAYGSYGKCYRCGEPGHWAPQCGQRAEAQKAKSDEERKEDVKRKCYGIKRPTDDNHKCLNCGQLGHGLLECEKEIQTENNFEAVASRMFDNNVDMPRDNTRSQRYWYWSGEAFEFYRRYKEKQKTEACQSSSYYPNYE